MGKQKELIKATVFFSILSLLQPLSNFLLLPLYTNPKYLTVQQYGYFSILNNISYFFTILSGLNIATAIVAFYKSYKRREDLRRFIGDVITFSIWFNALLLLVLSVFGKQFSALLFKEDIPFFPNVFLAAAFGLVSSIFLAHFNYLKYNRKLKEFAWLTIVQFLAFIALQYMFVVVFRQNITGALLARLMAVTVILLITLYLNRKYVFRKIDYKNNILPQLRYSLITGPAVLIGWMSVYADRFVIEHRSNDKNMLGQYSFLATICAIAELGIYAFNSAVQPFVFDSYEEKDRAGINNYYKIFIAGLILCTSAVILAGANLHFFIHNPEMTAVLYLIPVMTSGYIFFGVSSIYSLQLTYARKPFFYLITYSITLLVNIFANLLLIDKMGITGIIIAGLFTKLVQAGLMVYFGQRSYKTNALTPVIILSLAFIINVFACWAFYKYGIISLQLSVILQFLISICIILGAIKPRLIRQYILKKLGSGN